MAENKNFNTKNRIRLSLANLGSLARNLEFILSHSLANLGSLARNLEFILSHLANTPKMQEITTIIARGQLEWKAKIVLIVVHA